MMKEIEEILKLMRPAFSRNATYHWFIICYFGFVCRADFFGVSSIVRALFLDPIHYTSILNFFHSTAWSSQTFMDIWWKYICQKDIGHTVGGRLVLVGDHTKMPKDGRKMPAVVTLHQDSETGSKPSFFRGHHWGCIGMVMPSGKKFRALPIYATIQEGAGELDQSRKVSKTIQIVEMATKIAKSAGRKSYLVLDAYFSVGTVFDEAKKTSHLDEQLVHILTRAKKNITAHLPASNLDQSKRGRKKIYGEKIKLMALFDSKCKEYEFKKGKANLYDKEEDFEYLVVDLMWKPIKSMLRFILIRSSYGQMILISSDMNMEATTAIELYCRRVPIETLFDVIKNTLGGLYYHFWSSYLTRTSRTPIKNATKTQTTTNLNATINTLEAIEKFVNLQLFVIGTLQIIAKKYPEEVTAKAKCWLRTISNSIPSEFVTRMAIANSIKFNLYAFAKDWITLLILKKSQIPKESEPNHSKIA